MKKLISIFILFQLATGTTAKCKVQILRLTRATSQRFVGGAAGSPSGTYYKVYFVTSKNSKKIVIDQLWVGDDYYEVSAFLEKKSGASPDFGAGDSISISATRFVQNSTQLNNQEESKALPKKNKPYNYSGAALVGYKYGNKRKYLEIEKFELLKRAEYQ